MVHHHQQHRHGPEPLDVGPEASVARGGAGLLAAGEQTILFCQHDDSPSSWRMTDSAPRAPPPSCHPPGALRVARRPGEAGTARSVVSSGHVGHRGAQRCRRPRGEGPGVLPAPVPPDPRERRLVGHGLHRVAQRHPRPPALPRPLPAPRPRRARLLRPAGARGPRGPGRAGPRARTRRVRLLPLLVPRPAAPPAAVRRGPRLRAPRLPVRAVLGQRGVDPQLGRAERPGPGPPGVQRRRRHRPPALVGRGVRRSALHHRRRQAALPRLPAHGPARPASDDRPVAGRGPEARLPRSLPGVGGGLGLPAGRAGGVRLRRHRRVHAASDGATCSPRWRASGATGSSTTSAPPRPTWPFRTPGGDGSPR